jgi:hypothetical protein
MTTTIVHEPAPQTKPQGIPRIQPPPVRQSWRPEQAINDSLFALAAQLDGRDPLFDDIASIAATRLLMAGAELDVVAKRRAVRAQSRGPQ